jgi:hypothetical protein
MTTTKNEPNLLTQEELNIFDFDFDIDYIESTDTETDLDLDFDFDFDEPISITTSTENPLDKQLKALTGDGYSLADWTHPERTEDYILLKHIDTGLTVKWLLKK